MLQGHPLILMTVKQSFSLMSRIPLTLLTAKLPFALLLLINSYQNLTELFIDGDIIPSQEGTTQGNPLAMAMYRLATIPFIRGLDGLCRQVWYADDSMAAGKLAKLQEWWDQLTSEGPLFGYFPNASKKTWHITKDNPLEETRAIFVNSGVNITPNGNPILVQLLARRGLPLNPKSRNGPPTSLF